MKSLGKLILLMTLLIHSNSLVAQEAQNDSLRFFGQVTDAEKKAISGTLLVSYKKSDGIQDPDFYIQQNVVINSTGNFKFNLPDLKKPYKINIFLRSQLKETLVSKFFYVESGDQININVVRNPSGSLIDFNGKGAKKYTLASKLQDQFDREYRPKMNLLIKNWLMGKIAIKDSTEINLIMSRIAGVLRELKLSKSELIVKYNLGAEMGSIINHEFGPYNDYWVFLTKQMCATNPEYAKQIGQYYLQHRNEFFKAPDDPAKFCPNYLVSLSDKKILELMIDTESDKVQLRSLYDALKAEYSGDIRDRVLTHILTFWSIDLSTKPYNPSLKDSLLKDALSIVSFSYAKKALNNNIELISRTNTVKVKEAEFIGLDGKKVNLNSLRGKVLLIDTWFTGCAGCMQFHKFFEEEIHTKIKSNKDFVLLSLNMDETKEGWLSGISSKRYTSEESLNVWTGNFTDHPFLKYYRMQRGPALMLIDIDGTILYQPIGYKKEELIAKIQAALSKINNNSSK